MADTRSDGSRSDGSRSNDGLSSRVSDVRELTVERRAGPVAGRRVLGLREAARAAAVRPAPLAVILPHETMPSEKPGSCVATTGNTMPTGYLWVAAFVLVARVPRPGLAAGRALAQRATLRRRAEILVLCRRSVVSLLIGSGDGRQWASDPAHVCYTLKSCSDTARSSTCTSRMRRKQ